MTKQEIPAPEPLKKSSNRPNTGRFIDFAPRGKNSIRPSQATTAPKKPQAEKTAARPQSAPKAPQKAPEAPKTAISQSGTPRRRPVGLRMDFVRRTTVVSTPVAKNPAPVAKKTAPKSAPKPATPVILDKSEPEDNIPVKRTKKSFIAPLLKKVTHRHSVSVVAVPDQSGPVVLVPPAQSSVQSSAKNPAQKTAPKAAKRPVVKSNARPVTPVSDQDLDDELNQALGLTDAPDVAADDLLSVDDEVEPLMDEEALAIALAGFVDDEEPVTPVNNSRESSDFEEELNALDDLDTEIDKVLEAEMKDFVSEPKPLFDDSKSAPDANKYSLGGRSPFLTSVKVEKRPLSGDIPEEKIKSIKSIQSTPVKNVYRDKPKKTLADDAKEVHRQTLIIAAPEDGADSKNTPLFIAVGLTVLLGAMVGGLVYLIFFQ